MSGSTEVGTEAGPEHQAKHRTSQWLEQHGARVWWEQSNPFGYDQFTIERRAGPDAEPHTPRERPDMVVEFDDTGYAFAVEYKPGDTKGGVYDALLQLHGYWLSHAVHTETYIVGSRSVILDGFLTATAYSPDGHLFPPESESPQIYDDMSPGRQSCADYGQLPPAEYSMTEQHVRSLWRLAKRSEENVNSVHIPSVGSLLSTALEGDDDPAPAVLWNRGRTGQNWEVFRG